MDISAIINAIRNYKWKRRRNYNKGGYNNYNKGFGKGKSNYGKGFKGKGKSNYKGFKGFKGNYKGKGKGKSKGKGKFGNYKGKSKGKGKNNYRRKGFGQAAVINQLTMDNDYDGYQGCELCWEYDHDSFQCPLLLEQLTPGQQDGSELVEPTTIIGAITTIAESWNEDYDYDGDI